MTSMTITVTRTAKNIEVLSPTRYIHLTHGEINTYGYDINTLRSLEQNAPARDQLNATPPFVIPSYLNSDINSAGCLVLTATIIVHDVSAVPGLTVDNAFEIETQAKIDEANALGIGDFQMWRNKYYDDNFVTTFTATINETI